MAAESYGSIAVRRELGAYYSGEYSTSVSGRMYEADRSTRLGVVHQGLAGSDSLYVAQGNDSVARALAGMGLPLIDTQFGSPGGVPLWGNDTDIARVESAIAYGLDQESARYDKVVLAGQSKGGTAALNWAKANPTRVAAIILFVPAVDIQDIYDNNRAGNAASISAAYGGRPDDAHTPARNPTSFLGMPIAIWYSTDDPVILPSSVTTFASACGATLNSLGAVGHGDWDTYPGSAVASWVRAYLPVSDPATAGQGATLPATSRYPSVATFPAVSGALWGVGGRGLHHVHRRHRPALYVPLDERSGVNARDLGSAQKGGTYAGGYVQGAGAPGIVGGSLAVQLDGVNGRVTTTYAPFANGSLLTICGWAMLDAVAVAGEAALFSSGGSGSTPYLSVGLDAATVNFYPDSSGSGLASWSGAWPGTGRLAFWALTFDEAANSAELYVDGLSQGAKTASDAYPASPGNFQIGARGSGLSNPWPGRHAHVAVYERILTAAEIGEVYRAGSGLGAPRAVAA